jgi:nucleotide sugar dehydrogenase
MTSTFTDWTQMIGIIGLGMVGKAVRYGFSNVYVAYSDPKYNLVSINDLCRQCDEAIFVCVPTPTDDSNYSLLKSVLDEIKQYNYTGLVVVKSTVLPHHLEGYDVLYNPEFLSRATANQDFVNPPMVIIGGDRAEELLELYKKYSSVKLDNVFLTDIKTASLAKYMMNSFYALKVTYMNQMYDVAEKLGVEWTEVTDILATHPWMGSHHFQVPGPDGQRGFGGPCLPKDTEALTKEFEIPLLDIVLLLNKVYRR